MDIEIWSIGKNADNNLHSILQDYTQRVSKYVKISWRLFSNYQNDNKNIVLKKEAEMLLTKIPLDAFVIVLDRAVGEKFNSENFAFFIEKIIEANNKKIIFIIGGAYGIDNILLQRANKKICFSDFTLPHQLVKLFLIEQLFRAFTIINKIPYHN